jgi:hypothetical protein
MKAAHPRDFLNSWLSGSTFDLYSNCNSKFRELKHAKNRNDKDSIKFWSNRIDLISRVHNLLFQWFYLKEDQIKTKDDFTDFMKVFKRYAAMQTRTTWCEICTGGPKH